MRCLNNPKAITYSRGEDTSKNTSVIDLCFCRDPDYDDDSSIASDTQPNLDSDLGCDPPRPKPSESSTDDESDQPDPDASETGDGDGDGDSAPRRPAPVPVHQYSKVVRNLTTSDHRALDTEFDIEVYRTLEPARSWEDVVWEEFRASLDRALKVLPPLVSGSKLSTDTYVAALVAALQECQDVHVPVKIVIPPCTTISDDDQTATGSASRPCHIQPRGRLPREQAWVQDPSPNVGSVGFQSSMTRRMAKDPFGTAQAGTRMNDPNPATQLDPEVIDEKLVTDPATLAASQKAKLFPETSEFADGAAVLALPEPRPEAPRLAQHLQAGHDVTDEEVLGVLGNLKTRKACGPDGISPRVLKTCRHLLLEPFRKLSNQCLSDSATSPAS